MGKLSSLPAASVVIPTWNAAAFVRRIMPALLGQDLPLYEILVVDNGVVNSETEEVVREFASGFPRLRYLRFERQLGYAGAVNEGVKEASFPLVAVINNDNLAEPNWLSALVVTHQRLREEGREAVVSSLVDRPDFPEPLTGRFNFCGRYVRPSVRGTYVPFHPDGSAFLFDRSVFGCPYDEEYFIYHEDAYLGWRAWLTGREVVMETSSRARTFDGGSTRRIAYRTAYFTERNRWLNIFLFSSLLTLARLLPLLWLDAAIKFLIGSNRRAKFHAWVSIIFDWKNVLWKRKALQGERRRPDFEILPLLSGTYLSSGAAAPALNWVFRALAKLVGLPFGP